MQTFLPVPDFVATARVLDRLRLGKQRVEAWQILCALWYGGGFANHPAVKMWRGHTLCLTTYGLVMCTEWLSRGYRDTLLPRFAEYHAGDDSSPEPPAWLGDPEFHLSHRSNLLRKNPGHYRQFWPDDPADLPYVWPTTAE